MAVSKEVVYDAGNEALVLRAAIALSRDDRTRFRAIVHSIGADEFLVPAHSSIWRVLRHIADANLEYTNATVMQLLAAEPTKLEQPHVEELETHALVPANLEWHVKTLRWDATRARVLRGGLAELVQHLSDPRVTVERAMTAARSVVRSLEGGAGRPFIHRREERAATYKTELARRREKGNFYPCGFAAVDARLSEGFMPGNTAVITGLSGSGKSTFAARLAINLAQKGRKPLICAWEMGSTSTLDVLVSMLTGVPLDQVIKGTYSDEDWHRLGRAADWVNKKILFMENAFFGQVAAQTDGRRQRRSNERNLDILEGYIAESGCDCIIMDLWDRILADQSPEAVTEALYRQQNMHREYGVHGTLLVQLRLKDVERRADKRPTRESIKGVSTFVEVPDLIFGVHRDAQFKDVPDNSLELICMKQRKGQANWAVQFNWDGATSQITGGVEVPYNPGLEATAEGELSDPTSIRTRPRKTYMRRD